MSLVCTRMPLVCSRMYSNVYECYSHVTQSAPVCGALVTIVKRLDFRAICRGFVCRICKKTQSLDETKLLLTAPDCRLTFVKPVMYTFKFVFHALRRCTTGSLVFCEICLRC